MAIDKFNPIGELISLQDRMNSLLKDALSSASLTNDRSGLTWSPPVDFFETEETFVLMAEVPGLESEEVDIKIEDNSLIFSGERSVRKDQDQREYYRRERFQGKFRRTFNLPAAVQTDRISAELKTGILKITLPKAIKSGGRSVQVKINP